jgi:hypothetical protein
MILLVWDEDLSSRFPQTATGAVLFGWLRGTGLDFPRDDKVFGRFSRWGGCEGKIWKNRTGRKILSSPWEERSEAKFLNTHQI